MLKHHQLILPQIASSTPDRFASLKNLERAEKRFLVCFLTALTTGAYTLAMQLWNLTVSDVATLPIYRVIWIGLGAVTLASAILAILGYLSVGLVIQRAVEIRPREERDA